jgi:hypothetical protein
VLSGGGGKNCHLNYRAQEVVKQILFILWKKENHENRGIRGAGESL